VLDALRDPRVLMLAAANFLIVTGHYGVEFFLPTILQEWYGLHLDDMAWLIAAPFGVLLASQLAVSWSCFSGAMVGRAYLAPFYALPGFFLSGTAAAGAIGLINSIGNLGGFLGPYVLGAVQARTGSFAGGIYFLVAATAAAGVLILLLRQRTRPRAATFQVPSTLPRRP
jgi:ACS family tartrate transporter-like MFS transporter